jgi:methylase of polypeptide subunit release factors
MRSPHIPFAHALWAKVLSPNDSCLDATCGNGHDTLALARMLPQGQIFAFDLQEAAIEKTRQRLIQAGLEARATLFLKSHESFPDILPQSLQLIVYNLGYLPGGDKSLTTQSAITLKSLQNALPLLKKGGMIFITLYPGHPEGEIEAKTVLEFVKELPKDVWSVRHERFSTKATAPSVLYFVKNQQLPDNTESDGPPRLLPYEG